MKDGRQQVQQENVSLLHVLSPQVLTGPPGQRDHRVHSERTQMTTDGAQNDHHDSQ